MTDDTNTAERDALMDLIDAYAEARHVGGCHTYNAKTAEARAKVVASLAASAGAPQINGQLYSALGNLFSHLGMEGCVDADHTFVWDAMAALKRIDGGVHLDDLAVPVDPDAHRDDMLAAVRLLEGGEWAEHFAKTPIGMRLEDQITKLHNEVAASAGSEPVAHLWQHSETGRTRVLMPDMVVDACATWLLVGPLYLHPSPPEGAGWRPIATAPKDGTWIELWRTPTDCGRMSPFVIARWDSTESMFVWPEFCDPFTKYGRDKADADIAEGDCYGSDDFTHWMPLPTPPASEAKEL